MTTQTEACNGCAKDHEPEECPLYGEGGSMETIKKFAEMGDTLKKAKASTKQIDYIYFRTFKRASYAALRELTVVKASRLIVEIERIYAEEEHKTANAMLKELAYSIK